MHRFRPLRGILLALPPLLLACAAAGCRNGDGGRDQNLVLITLDTLRADHLGCYGDAQAITPNLDRIAGEGLRFQSASSPVPLTLPAHSTLLTGLLPPHHGLRNNGAGSLPSGTATLATLLAGQGYRTGAFVGAFVLDRRFGLTPGFEVYDDEVERDPSGATALEAERPGSAVIDRALAWLRQKEGRKERPFFLWVHLYDAHAPYEPLPEWRSRHAGRPYDGEISEVDRQVGRLLAALDEDGSARRTVVAVVGDHGEGLGEHGELTHGLLLYEPTLHVPLLIRAPGRLSPRVVSTPVSTADLAPTLAGLVAQALPAPAGQALDGRDLSAQLLAGSEPAAGEIYAETQYPALFGWSPLSALRRRGLKYISSSRPELYDLATDAKETKNLLSAPGGTAGLAKPAEGPAFAARLGAIEKSAVAGARPGNPTADAETRARLAALGYVAGVAPAPSDPAQGEHRPPPKVDLFQRFESAVRQLDGGEVKAAMAELSGLVASDPTNPVFRGKLAQAYRAGRDYPHAIELYRQAAETAGDDPEAWYNLAATLQEAGRVGEARTVVEQALRLDEKRPEAHNTLGIVYMTEGKPDSAYREFSSATGLDPRNAAAWNNLGNALRALRRPDEALNAYQRSVAVAPRYAEPLNGLGTLEVDRNRPREALSYFERALALTPNSHEIRLNRAIAFDLAGDTASAVAAYRDFLRATEGDPRFADQRRAAQAFLARLAAPAIGARGIH